MSEGGINQPIERPRPNKKINKNNPIHNVNRQEFGQLHLNFRKLNKNLKETLKTFFNVTRELFSFRPVGTLLGQSNLVRLSL